MQALPRLLSRDAYSFVTLAQATASTSSAVAPPASTAVEVVAPLEADGGGAAGDGDSEEEEESGTEMEESEESEETETEGEEETSDDDEGGEPVQRPTRLPRLPSNLLMSTVPDSTSTSTTTEEASAPATNGWVTFDPVTPTPTPGISSSTRTPRFLGSASNAEHSDSYFDVRRNPRNASPSQTPGAGGAGAPLRTPLLPMSLGNVTRGKRPTHEDDVVEVEGTGASTSVGVVPSGALAVPGVVAPNTTTEEGGLASPLYRRRRHSAIELLSPSLLDSEGRPLGGVGAAQTHEGLDLGVWNNAGARTPGPAFLTLPTPLLTPAISPTILTTNVSSPSTTTTTNSNPPLATPSSSLDPVSPAIATSPISPSPNNRLHRPRSMYELHVAPPEYHSLSHRSPFGLPGGVVGRGGTKQVVAPREEEGKEKLPRYSCAIHLEGYMPRKLEFTAPSVQVRCLFSLPLASVVSWLVFSLIYRIRGKRWRYTIELREADTLAFSLSLPRPSPFAGERSSLETTIRRPTRHLHQNLSLRPPNAPHRRRSLFLHLTPYHLHLLLRSSSSPLPSRRIRSRSFFR